MLTIVHVIDALKVGGAEQLLITFAEAVQGQDVSLTVLTFRVQAPHMQTALEALGAQVVVIEGTTLLDPRRLWRLYRFIRQMRPDVIHAHLTTAIILATWVGRRCDVPVVCTLHNTQLKSKNRGRVWLHRRALRHWASRVLAVGHTVEAEFAADIAPQPISVLPNAVAPMPNFDPTDLSDLRTNILGDFTGQVLICVGRLVAAKGHIDLLTAFEQVYAQFPHTRLLIVGEGILRPTIEAEIQARQLSEAVVMLGVRRDVPKLLAMSDLFVSASHWEGLPIAVLEAMASGLAVVGTAVGDMPHVVVAGTGVIVPAHQPHVLAEAINQLLADPTTLKQAGQAAQTRIHTHYAANTWAQTLLTLYHDLAQGHEANEQ